MRSRTVLIIAALILIFPLTTAATVLEGKTLPGRSVTVSVWSESGAQYQAPELQTSDIYGEYSYTYEGDDAPFEVLVIVKTFNVQEYREYFGPYAELGGTIQLPDLLPEDYVNPLGENDENEPDDNNSTGENNETGENDESNNTNENNETDNGNQSNITGDVTGEVTGDSLDNNVVKIFYYVLGAIFIIGVVAAIVVLLMTKLRGGAPAKPAKFGMEPVKLNEKYKSSGDDRDLDKIEEEIEMVEKQIEMYKKRNRLSEAEKRLEEKKKMLEKLKKGEK